VIPALDFDALATASLWTGCGFVLLFPSLLAVSAKLRNRDVPRCALRNCRKAGGGTSGLVRLRGSDGGTELVCRDHVTTTDLDRHADLAIAIASGHRTTSEEH
jgi:hypothetical protein